jgi:glycosyltransferase involved in cell wall biosynthesis
MDISIIVPTRNRSALLPTTLRSAMRQRDVNLEIIVVDDASTDDTLGVVAALGDERIRVIRHETRQGVSRARNLGAAEARADWLAFLDDDDLWAPEKLAQQLGAARQGPCDWTYTGAVVIDAGGRIVRAQRPLPPDEMVEALLHYDALPGGGSNVIVRKAAFQQTGPFDVRLRSGEDWEMWIRLAKHGPPACVCRPLIAKRLHHSNSTLDIAEIVRGTKLIEKLHHTTVDWGRLHRWMAHSCLRAGRRRTALGQFVRAAVRGEIRGVASDVGAMLKPPIVGDSEDALLKDPWIRPAAAWLQELQRSAQGFEEEPPAPVCVGKPPSFR